MLPGHAPMPGLLHKRSLYPAVGAGAIWDISDLSTLFEERPSANATTPSSVNGVVRTIMDKSGNGWHINYPYTSGGPILRQTGDLYYLEIVAHRLDFENTLLNSLGTNSVFGVAIESVVFDTVIYLIDGQGSSISGLDTNVGHPHSGFSLQQVYYRVDGVDKPRGNNGFGYYNGDTFNGDLNAGAAHVVTCENVNLTPFDEVFPTYLGGSSTARRLDNGRFYGGYISDGPFTSGERDDAEAWLASLSGVTL